MCGFEIIAKPDKNKRDHLLKQLISIVSCRFCRAEYDNEILLPYHTSAVDKKRFSHVYARRNDTDPTILEDGGRFLVFC